MHEVPNREIEKTEARQAMAEALRTIADEVENGIAMERVERAVHELARGIQEYIREERAEGTQPAKASGAETA